MTTQRATRHDRKSQQPCAHHWVLGDPIADSVSGRCKRCGEERAFPGSPEGTRRFDDFQELTSQDAYYREARSG